MERAADVGRVPEPDGSTALLVHNENDAPRDFAVAVEGRSFEYTLPGGAIATFRWDRARPDQYRPVEPWTAVVSSVMVPLDGPSP